MTISRLKAATDRGKGQGLFPNCLRRLMFHIIQYSKVSVLLAFVLLHKNKPIRNARAGEAKQLCSREQPG